MRCGATCECDETLAIVLDVFLASPRRRAKGRGMMVSRSALAFDGALNQRLEGIEVGRVRRNARERPSRGAAIEGVSSGACNERKRCAGGLVMARASAIGGVPTRR